MKVLVVDDQPDCAFVLGKLLEHSGFEVLLAHCGAEALQLSEAHRPQAVVLDIELPDIPGDKLARRLRNNLGLNSARVVAVSGSELDRETLIQNGIDAALLKPVGIQELIAVLAGDPRPKTLILKSSQDAGSELLMPLPDHAR